MDRGAATEKRGTARAAVSGGAAGRRILVLVPAKDEEHNLRSVLAELLPKQPAQDVLVVDDGSQDGTAALAATAGCRVLRHAVNLGYGATLLTGYHFALREGYDVVVQIDGDGQHPPAEIERLTAPILAGRADVVIGSRYSEGGAGGAGPWRRLAARALAWIARQWTGLPVTDPTSGMQALSRAALVELCTDGFPDDYPDLDVLIHLHRRGFRLAEVPVVMRPRRTGRSMHGGVKVLYYFYRLAVCLALLPVRRCSPYRRERRAAAA